MTIKYRLTLLLTLSMLSICNISNAQSSRDSKVVIEMTYKDSDGKKHTETIEYVGQKAESFDADEFEKSLEKREITILNLNINQSSSKEMKGKLHEDHDVKIKEKGEFKCKEPLR